MNHVDKCLNNEIFMNEFLQQIESAKITKTAEFLANQIDNGLPVEQENRIKSYFGKFASLNKNDLITTIQVLADFYIDASIKRYELVGVDCETKKDKSLGKFCEYIDAEMAGEDKIEKGNITSYSIKDLDSVGESLDYEISNGFASIKSSENGYLIKYPNKKPIRCSNDSALVSALQMIDEKTNETDAKKILDCVKANKHIIYAFDFYGPNPPAGSNNSSVEQRTPKTNDFSDSLYETWPDVNRPDIVTENDPLSLDNNVGYGRGKNIPQDIEMMKNDNNANGVKDVDSNRWGDTSNVYKEYSEQMQMNPKSAAKESAPNPDEEAMMAKIQEITGGVVRDYLVSLDTIEADLELSRQTLEKYYNIPALKSRVEKVMPEIQNTIGKLKDHQIVVENVAYRFKTAHKRLRVKPLEEVENIVNQMKELVSKSKQKQFEELHKKVYQLIEISESFKYALAPEQKEIEEVKKRVQDSAKRRKQDLRKQHASLESITAALDALDESLATDKINYNTFVELRKDVDSNADSIVETLNGFHSTASFVSKADFMDSVKKIFSTIYDFVANTLKPFESWLDFANNEWEKLGDSIEEA